MTAPTLTAHDFDQELLIVFDAYVHGDANHTAHTQHGFNNDTTPRFDATAAQLA